jgi:hypothetical protein
MLRGGNALPLAERSLRLKPHRVSELPTYPPGADIDRALAIWFRLFRFSELQRGALVRERVDEVILAINRE